MKYLQSLFIDDGTDEGRILHVKAGVPLPLGLSTTEQGINFAFFSKNAIAAKLVIFNPKESEPLFEVLLDQMNNQTGDIWHVTIENLPTEFCYAYRVDGEYAPKRGHYFNEHNLLIDPYARALTGREEWDKPRPIKKPTASDRNKYYYRSFYSQDFFNWEDDRPINRPLKDTVIYELHVRGFTVHESSLVSHPGTFSGIIEKIPHLRDLGITAVELMPINEFDETDCLYINPHTGAQLKNLWGYSSVNFFSPKASYADAGTEHKQIDEFKTMVKELHKAGIEVILDVVFNHTAEGNEHGPTFCFRGLENEVYYMLDDKGGYKNYSGCGNTLNCNHPVVREMILDCLRYWVSEMHVDGFRFDLASILGRDQEGRVLANPPVLEAIAMDPILADTKIIAEAWDAAGLYQVGHFPAWQRWAEWNDKYRDCIRRFVVGEPGVAGEMATRIAGSSDLYGPSDRKPYHSINYVTCHDGFTLNDVVSYNGKHNEMNGEGNNDGHNANYSWNCGIEGETKRAPINKFRKRQMKNFIALLLLSQGTPMILAGDEFARTQKGNNNAYCHDNEISWIDWGFKEKHADLFRFMKEMILFRKTYSILRRPSFFTGLKPYKEGLPDISWHGPHLDKPNFSKTSRTLAFLLSGKEGEDATVRNDIYVAVNTSKRKVRFKLPELQGKKWFVKVDTGTDGMQDIYENDHEVLYGNQSSCMVKGYSLVILLSKPE